MTSWPNQLANMSFCISFQISGVSGVFFFLHILQCAYKAYCFSTPGVYRINIAKLTCSKTEMD